MDPQPPPISQPKPFPLVPILLVLLVLLLGATAFLVYQNMQLQKQIIELTNKPTPSPAVVPGETGTQAGTANWKTYTNTQYQYSFKYPAKYETFITQKDTGINMGCGCEFFTWFDVETTLSDLSEQDWWAQLGKQWFNGTTTISGTYHPNAFRVTKSESKLIGQNQVLTINASSVTPSAMISPKPWQATSAIPFQVYILKNKKTLVLFTVYQTGDQNTFDQILSTFTFTDQTTATYTCPANGWVDCMPGPVAKPECSEAAMTWYKANCPNFQGGAL